MIADTPEQIQAFRLLALKGALKLEVQGLTHSSGRSAYAQVKREFDLHGSKQHVLAQYEALLRRKGVLLNRDSGGPHMIQDEPRDEREQLRREDECRTYGYCT